MSLKLFRSTGYSSILVAGETRKALHPAWLVIGISLWIGFVCNVALWRQVAGAPGGGPGMSWAVMAGVFAASLIALVLSVLGWRRTLKPAASLLLLAAGLAACGIWAHALPLEPALLQRGASTLLPGWSALMRWQVGALLALLALVPLMWVWQTPVRRLPGPTQFAANMTGMFVAGGALAASGFMLLKGLA